MIIKTRKETHTTSPAYRVYVHYRRNEIHSVVLEQIGIKKIRTVELIPGPEYLLNEEILITDWDTLEDAMQWEYEMIYC